MASLHEKMKLPVLKRMYDRACWTHKHMNINHLVGGLPPHERDTSVLKDVISELSRLEWVITKPTHYGLELSLNSRKKKEIDEYIEKRLA
ncbi:MAG: hypothetical protein HYW25_01130 [Candidatus Aenigmarchaeota archaeon]|nr:hypothetical protein [Candidatus Aenigmarchaeota archaeon]